MEVGKGGGNYNSIGAQSFVSSGRDRLYGTHPPVAWYVDLPLCIYIGTSYGFPKKIKLRAYLKQVMGSLRQMRYKYFS